MNDHGPRDSDPQAAAGAGFASVGYEGKAGNTTLDRVHVTIPDGSIESIQVYTKVNVGTHPHLAEAAQQGRLHRFDTGEFLAIPWVYHDPGLERLYLVVPPSLRHRELSERAALMKAIADDSAVSVPQYVRDFESVVGVEGLMEALASASSPAGVEEQSDNLARQTEALRVHEERLVAFQAQLEQERERLANHERALAEQARQLRLADEANAEELLAPVETEIESSDPTGMVMTDSLVEDVVDDEVVNIGDDDGDILLEPDASQELDLLDEIPDVAAPEGFMESPVHAMAGVLSEGRFWLFAKLSEDASSLEAPSLLIQLSIVDEIPVVMLTLVEQTAPRSFVRRLVLLPTQTEDRAILRFLAQNFSAQILVFSADGIYEREVEVRADLEENARWVLDQIEGYEARTASEEQNAVERALAAPPPVNVEGHPYAEELTAPSTAQEARELTSRIGSWMSAESRHLALAALSIPIARLHQTVRTAASAGINFGVVTSEELLRCAVELGVVDGVGAAVDSMIRVRLQNSSDQQSELSPSMNAEVWSELMELAWVHSVAVDQATFEAAWTILKEDDPERLEPGEGVSDDPSSWSEAELRALMRRPDRCILVGKELVRRGGPTEIEMLVDLTSRVGEQSLAELGEILLGAGEALGSAMIDLLGANRAEVRHLAALVLGASASRRAAVPLVAALLSEPSERWREIARALALLGPGSSRPLARAMKDPKGQDERLVYALTHLAVAGHSQLITDWQGDKDPMTAGIALRVPSTEDVVTEHLEGVTSGEGTFAGVELAHRIWQTQTELSNAQS